MLCKIADLYVDVPTSGGLASRCGEYVCDEQASADIVIREDRYHREKYPEGTSEDLIAYMESASQFFTRLLRFNGIYLHASCVEVDGRAYLFSADSGTGKSTHSRLWQQIFGEKAVVFNDDKPALRRLDGTWYAYGLPWCGKDGININMKVPVGGICFLRRGENNSIRRLSPLEASVQVIFQTTRRFKSEERLDLLLSHVDKLVREIPVYELYCTPTADAARLSSETMRRGAEEVFL